MAHHIQTLPADQARRLLPLLWVVHDLHVAADPARFVADPDPDATARYLQDWLSREGVTALVTGTGPLTGYLIYEIEHREGLPLVPPRHRAFLHHISVDPEHRRQGIATALIGEMRRRVRADGIPQIATSYSPFNTASAALMRAQGLRPAAILADGPS